MVESIEVLASSRLTAMEPPYLRVKGESYPPSATEPNRTVSEHQNGLSVKETQIISAALNYMAGFPLIGVDIAPHSKSETEARDIIRDVRSRLVQWLRRHGMPAYWLDVLEAKVGVHSHLIMPVPSRRAGLELIQSIKAWKFDQGDVRGKTIYDLNGAQNYLLKESTTQAWWAASKAYRRDKGSHKLGIGGGDRVHLSKDLEVDLVGSGRIENRTKTYVSRALRNPTLQPARTASQAPASVMMPVLARLNPSPYVTAFILAGRTRQIPLLLGPVL